MAVPVVARAGFSPGSRTAFFGLAGLALLAAVWLDDAAAWRAARRPAVLALGALAALSIASAGWAIATPSAAVQWGLVVAGYGAVVVSAAVVTRHLGAAPIAVGLTVLATTAGLFGLAGVALHELPFAERLRGAWRPGGLFQYPPALAVAQVMVLPALYAAMSHRRLPWAAAGASGLAIAGAVLGLAGNRFALGAAGALVLLGLVAAPSRPRAAVAAGLLLASGVAAYLVAGGFASVRGEGSDAARLAGLAAVLLAVPAAWVAVRSRLAPGVRRHAARRTSLAVVAAGVIVAVVAGSGTVPGFDPLATRATQTGGITHGRVDLWREATATFADRPVLGSGADTYALASRPHQRGAEVRFAHNLPLQAAVELGVAGLLAAIVLLVAAAWGIRRAPPDVRLLLGPAVAVFAVAQLLDWTWQLAGAGAIWAAALGALLSPGANRADTGSP